MPALETTLAFTAFAWGAIWGSFLNVVIHRLPNGGSLLTPPSHCPACGKPIRWYQNIPIVSYLFLGGKCAECKVNISLRYPLVELVAATLSLAVWRHVVHNPYIPSLEIAGAVYIIYFFFVMACVAITFIDLEHLIIPDILSLPAVPIGFVFNLAMQDYTRVTWQQSLIGLAAGSGAIALFILAYYLVTRRVGMGWGDAKLMAMVGAFFGWKSLIFVLLAGSLQGIIYSLFALPALKKEQGLRRAMIPFGPFLVLAALEWFFFSSQIDTLFQRVFRL